MDLLTLPQSQQLALAGRPEVRDGDLVLFVLHAEHEVAFRAALMLAEKVALAAAGEV